MGYQSLDRDKIQKAFAIAHRASQRYNTPAQERKLFRAIARLIWDAASEDGPYPKSCEPPEVQRALAILAEPEIPFDAR